MNLFFINHLLNENYFKCFDHLVLLENNTECQFSRPGKDESDAPLQQRIQLEKQIN